MRKAFTIPIIVASAMALVASSASAGVVNCSASGNSQRNGAIIGGIAGAIVGNNVSHKAGAPIVGAVAGAAAGSAIGCEKQKDKARAASYTGNSVATATITIRARPSVHSARVATLHKGQHAEVIRWEGNWAVVSFRDAAGTKATGYVSSGYLKPAR